MKMLNTIRFIAAYAILTRANGAFAHEGHLLEGNHWHATDVWGFAAAGLLVALAIWLSRR
jgi:hypothetical protein